MSAVSLVPSLGRSEVRALGTTAEVLVTESRTIAMADVLLRRQLERVDLLASRFRADSEVSLLNAGGGRPVQVSEGLAELVEVALRAACLTDGAVDPTVGAAMGRIGYDRDFAAMVKDQPGGSPAPEPAPGWQTI
ncbi:MAG TPA: FAD:protein FMN transferase, partial [Acidimicrobiales bacterium]|nr:FAD:protein FMN transferase [Acidimicrobiales bacterium]